MGKAIERIFLPLMQLQLPEIRDISMPAEGVFHNLILVSIRKSYPGHARKVMHAIWGLGQAMFSKCIVVVDEDVDVQNSGEVAWRALNNIDPERDIEFVHGPVDSLDHSSRLANYGSKMAWMRLASGRKRDLRDRGRTLSACLRMFLSVWMSFGRRPASVIPAIATWKLNTVQALALACLGAALGVWLRRRIRLLDRLEIPAPVRADWSSRSLRWSRATAG